MKAGGRRHDAGLTRTRSSIAEEQQGKSSERATVKYRFILDEKPSSWQNVWETATS